MYWVYLFKIELYLLVDKIENVVLKIKQVINKED